MINVQVLQIEAKPTGRSEWANNDEEDSDGDMCDSTQPSAKLCNHYKVHFFTRKARAVEGISGFDVGRLLLFD